MTFFPLPLSLWPADWYCSSVGFTGLTGQTINSGFTASSPFLSSCCLCLCGWASGAGWIFTAAFRVSAYITTNQLNNICQEKIICFYLFFYCWLDRAVVKHIRPLIHLSIQLFFHLFIHPFIHPTSNPPVYPRIHPYIHSLNHLFSLPLLSAHTKMTQSCFKIGKVSLSLHSEWARQMGSARWFWSIPKEIQSRDTTFKQFL